MQFRSQWVNNRYLHYVPFMVVMLDNKKFNKRTKFHRKENITFPIIPSSIILSLVITSKRFCLIVGTKLQIF